VRKRYSVMPSHMREGYVGISILDVGGKGRRTNRSRADHVVVWNDAEFPPAVDHGKEAEVVIP
jgi:hypothetical protein